MTNFVPKITLFLKLVSDKSSRIILLYLDKDSYGHRCVGNKKRQVKSVNLQGKKQCGNLCNYLWQSF